MGIMPVMGPKGVLCQLQGLKVIRWSVPVTGPKGGSCQLQGLEKDDASCRA